jgi:hypothetical protein
LWLYVEDSDTLFKSAVSAGAKVQMPMADQFWGDRGGAVEDPAGYTWWIATRKEDLTPAEIQQRAAEFFKQNGAAGAIVGSVELSTPTPHVPDSRAWDGRPVVSQLDRVWSFIHPSTAASTFETASSGVAPCSP